MNLENERVEMNISMFDLLKLAAGVRYLNNINVFIEGMPVCEESTFEDKKQAFISPDYPVAWPLVEEYVTRVEARLKKEYLATNPTINDVLQNGEHAYSFHALQSDSRAIRTLLSYSYKPEDVRHVLKHTEEKVS